MTPKKRATAVPSLNESTPAAPVATFLRLAARDPLEPGAAHVLIVEDRQGGQAVAGIYHNRPQLLALFLASPAMADTLRGFVKLVQDMEAAGLAALSHGRPYRDAVRILRTLEGPAS